MGRLKRLLLLEEQREIAALRGDVTRLYRRVGTDSLFARSVADILVHALQTAEVEDHRELARVMAPLVISGIRREIVESRDLMVETLYPITLRLVAAAVAAAMRELSDDINRKIETFSPRGIQLRLKAAVTRRPLSELLLAESASGALDRLVLIDRRTGGVIATTGLEGDAAAGADQHLLGGLVAALVEFANHALHDVHGDLRSIDVGGRSVLLRASPLYIVAAMTSASTISPKLHAAADGAFLGLLEQLVGVAEVDSQGALSSLHEALTDAIVPPPAKKRVSPLVVIGVVAAIALGGIAIQSWLAARHRAAEATLLPTIETSPSLQGFPVHLDLDGTTAVRISGVLASPDMLETLETRVAAAFPGRTVEPRVAILSQTAEAKATMASLDKATARIATLEASLAKATALLEERLRQTDAATAVASSRIAEGERRVDLLANTTTAAVARLDTELSGKSGRDDVEQAAARILTPGRRLVESVASTAVFFEGGATYRDPERAERDLGALAHALDAVAGAKLRVVGYGDGTGTAKGNADAAGLRVERVIADLHNKGIAADRLIPVSTRLPLPIADQPSGGRRVVFELAYPAE